MKPQTTRPPPRNGNGQAKFEHIAGARDAETEPERLIPQGLPLASGPPLSELPNSELPRRPIAEIIVGDRHRKDLGDIEGLAASIEDIGLLHPIIVDQDGQLLAGGRRLVACKLLGWSEIPVTVVRVP
jgi:ParB family chromosome partitioning protein